MSKSPCLQDKNKSIINIIESGNLAQ